MEAADEEKYSNYFKSYSSAFELKTEDYRKQRKTSADDECSDFKNDHLVPKLSKCTIKCAYSDPFNIHERNSYLSPYLEAESALLFAPTRTRSVSEPVPFEKVAASGTDLLQIANKKSTNASKQFGLGSSSESGEELGAIIEVEINTQDKWECRTDQTTTDHLKKTASGK